MEHIAALKDFGKAIPNKRLNLFCALHFQHYY